MRAIRLGTSDRRALPHREPRCRPPPTAAAHRHLARVKHNDQQQMRATTRRFRVALGRARRVAAPSSGQRPSLPNSPAPDSHPSPAVDFAEAEKIVKRKKAEMLAHRPAKIRSGVEAKWASAVFRQGRPAPWDSSICNTTRSSRSRLRTRDVRGGQRFRPPASSSHASDGGHGMAPRGTAIKAPCSTSTPGAAKMLGGADGRR